MSTVLEIRLIMCGSNHYVPCVLYISRMLPLVNAQWSAAALLIGPLRFVPAITGNRTDRTGVAVMLCCQVNSGSQTSLSLCDSNVALSVPVNFEGLHSGAFSPRHVSTLFCFPRLLPWLQFCVYALSWDCSLRQWEDEIVVRVYAHFFIWRSLCWTLC